MTEHEIKEKIAEMAQALDAHKKSGEPSANPHIRTDLETCSHSCAKCGVSTKWEVPETWESSMRDIKAFINTHRTCKPLLS